MTSAVRNRDPALDTQRTRDGLQVFPEVLTFGVSPSAPRQTDVPYSTRTAMKTHLPDQRLEPQCPLT